MKHKRIIFFSVASILSIGGFTFAFSLLKHQTKSYVPVLAVDSPTTIYLRDNTNEEIRDYYSDLDGLASSELQGENLLKHLKPILSENMVYYSYNQVGNIYVITDRDWTNSPVESLASGTYDSEEQTITKFSYSTEGNANPYLKLLYYDGYYEGNDTYKPIHYKGYGSVSTGATTSSFDKEHAWSQSHGFSTAGDSKGPAGTDMHHLKAGTQYGNRTLHNNYSYGYVLENDSKWAKVLNDEDPHTGQHAYDRQNKRGNALNAHEGDPNEVVFEPQDCDKGDIARALLYMVARYNNIGGSEISDYDPALKLVDYLISETSTGLSTTDESIGYYGILSDILAWHYADPVDEYEIHRNNIIYNTYQHNRNPFIDYPEWVEYIWGTGRYDEVNREVTYDSTPTGYVDLSKDVINGYREKVPEDDTTSTLTVTRSSFTSSTSGLGTMDSWSQDGFNGKGDTSTVTTYLNFSTSSLVSLYNETKLGFIKKIDVNMTSNYTKTNGTLDLYLGDSVRYNSGLVGSKHSTLNISPGANSFTIDSGNYTYFALSKPNVAGFYVDSFVITYDNAELNATKWANSFLTTTGAICKNDGSTTFSSLSSAWTTFKGTYEGLAEASKAYYSGACQVLDSDNATTINNMLARYRMICSKYNKISIQLEEFIDDIVINHSNRLSVSNSLNLELIIYLSIGASLLGLSLALILRKRKHYNV